MEDICWIHNERFPEDGHCSECHKIQVMCQNSCYEYEDQDDPEEKQGFSFLVLVGCVVFGLIMGWFLAIIASKVL